MKLLKAGKKTNHGGKRKGAGAKPKYNEQTKTISFRCPVSKIDEIKLIVTAKLNEYAETKKRN